MQKLLTREIQFRADQAGDDAGIPCVISSTTPVDRGDFIEVLSHHPRDVDLARAPLPLQVGHDTGPLNVGIVDGLHFDGEVLRGTARFGSSAAAREILADVKTGILRNLSVGYRLVREIGRRGTETLFAWQPYEVSVVGVPADHRAGFNRNADLSLDAPAIRTSRKSAAGQSSFPERKTTMSQVDLSPMNQEFSLSRAIAAAASGDWRDAGYEREVGQELQRNHGNARGLLVPTSVLFTRGTRVMNTTDQASLVPNDHLGFIDALRTHSRVVEAGATVLPGLVGNVDIPRQTASVSAEWLAEDGALTGGDGSLDSMTLTPKTVGARTSWTRRMMLQSVPGIEELARNDLAAVIGRAVDLAAIHGSGNANQPTGIYAAIGTNSVAMGGVPTFGKLVDMCSEVARDNALEGNLRFMTTPGLAGKLAQTLMASSAGSDMIWSGNLYEGQLAGFGAFATNQVSSTLGAGSEHGLIFGNWAELVVGQWGALDVIVDPYTDSARGRVNISAFISVDIGLRHVVSFCKATGATA